MMGHDRLVNIVHLLQMILMVNLCLLSFTVLFVDSVLDLFSFNGVLSRLLLLLKGCNSAHMFLHSLGHVIAELTKEVLVLLFFLFF